MIREYIVENWALILVLIAFAVSIRTTVFMDKSTARRMCVLIPGLFLLSVVVFLEFWLTDRGGYRQERVILMAVRYSATPVIVAMLLYTLVRRVRWFIFIPALVLTVVNIISVFTGIVFSLDEAGALRRGPLGLLPYIVAGLYGVSLVWILYRQSNRLYTEIVPIAFLAFAFASGLFLPFVFGKAFSQMFCITIAIALLVYYEFSLLQQTKKDPLTGVLNRQAYYADTKTSPEDITALVTTDMNGLKEINDSRGHEAGDEALTAIALGLLRAAGRGQSVYRIGGDEFIILCRRASREDVVRLAEDVGKNIGETGYHCAIGYSWAEDGKKDLEEMLRESDRMMYENKAQYYRSTGRDRRRRSPDR